MRKRLLHTNRRKRRNNKISTANTGSKQLFGSQGLTYGLFSPDDSNKWQGSNAPIGRRSSSIVDACLVVLVEGVISCRPMVVSAAGEEVEHEITDWINKDFLAGTIRNGAYSGSGVALINETPDLTAAGLAVLPSSRLEIERTGTAAKGENRYTFTDLTRQKVTYTADQVFHYKYQVDPDRPWIGRSPLTNVDNDILLDARSSAFGSAFMKNAGLALYYLMPKGGRVFTDNEIRKIRNDITANTTGDGSGGAGVLPIEVDIQQLQGPRQFIDLEAVRASPEFRICAQLGVPPVLAVLGAGYRFTTANSTLKEIRRHFADATIKPLLDSIAEVLTIQVLNKSLDSDGLRVTFDCSDSFLFARDLDNEVARANMAAGFLTIDERRAMIGYDPIGDERGNQIELADLQREQTEPGVDNQVL